MLISKVTKIKWNAKIKKHYVDLGYVFTKMGDAFDVNINDLTSGSHAEVIVMCDYCKNEYAIHWDTYMKIHGNRIISNDCCKDCLQIKAEESVSKKYGNYSNMFNTYNDKRKRTNIDKYGCENPFSNKEIISKIRNTNINKYGVEYPTQNQEIKEKTKQTNLDKYGYVSYCQTPEWRENNRGENNCRWKGDDVKNPRTERDIPEYRDWRKAVFSRDKYTCMSCGAKNGNGKYIRLEAHHILNWSSNFSERHNVNNGITLCSDCHTLFHKIYGKKNNNMEQLIDFIKNINIDENIC